MDRRKTPADELLKLNDPMEIFDLTCAYNYFAGGLENKMPVEDNRRAFARIKHLLTAQRAKREKS